MSIALETKVLELAKECAELTAQVKQLAERIVQLEAARAKQKGSNG
jgi:hypothetical protein